MTNRDYMKTEKYRKIMSRAMKGRVITEEHRKKISESRKKRKIIPWNKGIPCSEEQKRKVSMINKGQLLGIHRSPGTEFKKGITPWNKEKKMSQEFCDRIGMNSAHKGLFSKRGEIINLYVSREMSTRDIAKLFDCSRIAIRYLLRKEGIKLRTKATPEQYKKVSKKLQGREFSLETRTKMSALPPLLHIEKWDNFTGLEPYSNNWINSLKNKIRKRDNQVCMMCGINREKLKIA